MAELIAERMVGNVKQPVQQLSGAVRKRDGGVFRGRPGQDLAHITSYSGEKPWKPPQKPSQNQVTKPAYSTAMHPPNTLATLLSAPWFPCSHSHVRPGQLQLGL
jgi:hypothetical protein